MSLFLMKITAGDAKDMVFFISDYIKWSHWALL